MKPVNFQGASAKLQKPKDWEESTAECDPLPIRRIKIGAENMGGLALMESVWRPSADERKRIAKGENVLLWVAGDTHPPVAVSVTDREVIE